MCLIKSRSTAHDFSKTISGGLSLCPDNILRQCYFFWVRKNVISSFVNAKVSYKARLLPNFIILFGWGSSFKLQFVFNRFSGFHRFFIIFKRLLCGHESDAVSCHLTGRFLITKAVVVKIFKLISRWLWTWQMVNKVIKSLRRLLYFFIFYIRLIFHSNWYFHASSRSVNLNELV